MSDQAKLRLVAIGNLDDDVLDGLRGKPGAVLTGTPEGVRKLGELLLDEVSVGEANARDWKAEVGQIAHALGVEYATDGRASEPGPLEVMLDQIKSLQASEATLAERELEDERAKASARARELRPGCPEQVEFWDAIHAYARASYTGEEGGPSGPRMAAAARVEEAARKWPGTSQSRFCAYEDCDQEPSALCVAHAEADSIAAVVAWLRAEAEDPRTAHAGGVDALHDAADDIESGAWRKGATHRKEASTVREIAASLLDAAEAHATGAQDVATSTAERAVLDIVALARRTG